MPPQVYGGRWRMKGSLSEGGQAHTFLVTDDRAGGEGTYVLKRLKNTGNPQRMERFRREVDVVRRLSHPNIVNIIDFDTDHDPPYFVSNYYRGGTLADKPDITEGDPIASLSLILEICHGLKMAHADGVIHRDLTTGTKVDEKGPARQDAGLV
jgi:eukaryotic-like serine/threonine-protein kinase